MIDGADWLCREYFGRSLIDERVNILDPCTGTGTFICEMLESFRGDPKKLAHKYSKELYANEVAILPYYVANLNIEATYAAITGNYAEYPNLCFVDTLDNVAALGLRSGHQHDMFGAMSDENIERVKRQNEKTISVIIGNPPYNANQQNENDNNKNRTYKRVDEIIKRTYVNRSTAQKTKVYDMYARFYRWASDRLGDDGVIAFITNRSFIDSRTFDGFRADVVDTFSDIYVVDLGGDVRANPKISGTTHNVFGIQTGVAIAFMVKRKRRKKEKEPASIRYARRPEMETADDKLSFLAGTDLSSMTMDKIEPSKRGNWINQVENEWDDLLPIADKKTKAAKGGGQERAIFKLFSLGFSTNRDLWVVDQEKEGLLEKVRYFHHAYEGAVKSGNDLSEKVKASRNLQRRLRQEKREKLSTKRVQYALYRPFTRRYVYNSDIYIDEKGSWEQMFPDVSDNTGLAILKGERQPFSLLGSDLVANLNLYSADPASIVTRYRYTSSGERIDNITGWGLRKFQAEYGKSVTKDDIFHYCYAVLHDPVYRETYAINLKREFPRIPFYPDFEQWVAWGEKLMKLHISYEDIEPWPLKRLDTQKKRAEGSEPKAILRSDHDNGNIRLDADTQMTGVPAEAWRYRLGNRTAIDWVLDQHKEKKPRDPTIREKFNTYRFADHKEKVINLLGRVTRVSVETVEITDAMKALNRDDWDATGEDS